jgi:hypothetical protein
MMMRAAYQICFLIANRPRFGHILELNRNQRVAFAVMTRDEAHLEIYENQQKPASPSEWKRVWININEAQSSHKIKPT